MFYQAGEYLNKILKFHQSDYRGKWFSQSLYSLSVSIADKIGKLVWKYNNLTDFLIRFVRKVFILRTVTWGTDYNDTAIFTPKIIPLMYMDVTQCITYNPPGPSKARWGGHVIEIFPQNYKYTIIS